MRVLPTALTAFALALLVAGCVPSAPEPAAPDTAPPVGPVPAPSGPLTLDRVAGIVSEDEASGTMLFSAGDAVSTSGDDLATENDYWIGVGGRPEQCAGVVSAPYLVSAHDTGERLDDPSALVGTFTELDEDRFGLVQVYARQFDDPATASGFLGEFTATVNDCPAYQLVDDGTVTLDVVGLATSEVARLPAGVGGLHYVETLRDSAAESITITFLQRDGIVISVYGELTPSSTITQAQVDGIATSVAERLAQL